MTAWSAPADVKSAVQREWDSGRLLAARVPGGSGTVFPFAVRLRRPSAKDLAARFDDAQRWAASHGGGGYRLQLESVPNRMLGAQTLPVSAWLDSPDDALRLIGRLRDTAAFDALLGATPQEFLPAVAARPLAVLAVAPEWPQIVAVAQWLLANPRPGGYLRQVDLPGVHSKVIERNKRLIATLVPATGPASGRDWFEHGYGFATKPGLIRFRSLDAARAPLPGLTDVTLPVAEFTALQPALRRVFVTENEINFLAFPDVAESIVVFGHGNGAPELLGGVGWLAATEIHYWGDIDTHGLAILDRFRSRLPRTASLLMDEATLLSHRDSWVVEEQQVRRDLPNLTDAEAHLYAGLCEDRWGRGVRLEQEFVRFSALTAALRGLA